MRFVLPDGWRVAVPWTPAPDEENVFHVGNKGILMQSCVLIGNFTEREVRTGDTVVRLAIGRGLDPYAAELELAVSAVVPAYRELFDDTPQARFLAVVNVNPTGGITDGSAYPNSVSVLTPRRMEGANFVQAIYTIAHEILHLWNGFRLRPEAQAEWFREGVTDYLTWRTLIDLGIIGETPLLVELRRQLTAYLNLDRKVSIAAAGENKSENATLVYEGGSLTALCLDSFIRERSGGKNGFPEFMRELYARSAKKSVGYNEAMIVDVARDVGGGNLQPFFDRFVNGMEALPLEERLAAIGIELKTRKSGGRVVVAIDPDESATGAAANTRDEFLGRR